MSLTPSTMLPLGTTAPDFALPTGAGTLFNRDQLVKSNGLLVIFMSNHCPFVIHLASALAKLGDQIEQFDIGMVAINANDVEAYPDDSPAKMVLESAQRGYHFPYLFDQSQATAKAYEAACTPDFFLFDGELKLVYRGQFDTSTPGNDIPVTGDILYQALTALSQGQPINSDQVPSMGCNIKWKK
ncbi:MAG: thiol-disulfide isomerase/thioredoxin [Phenylobacterium sp.]|jgi:thiol-disulfide isomerase/thioredoxin